MRKVLLMIAICAPLAAQQEPSIRLPVHCAKVQWPADDVLKALGFVVESGGISGTWIYGHAYRTRDWIQVWRQVKRPAEAYSGLLGYVAGLRPRFAELSLHDILVDWRTGVRHCEVRLAVDYNGYRRGFTTEGIERYRSTGALERRILELVRLQVWAKGYLDEP